jgi:hypothetical protein
VTTPPNQITGANSRHAGQSDGSWSYNAVVSGASTLPAAVAQFYRSAKNSKKFILRVSDVV